MRQAEGLMSDEQWLGLLHQERRIDLVRVRINTINHTYNYTYLNLYGASEQKMMMMMMMKISEARLASITSRLNPKPCR